MLRNQRVEECVRRFGGFCDKVEAFDAEMFRVPPAEAVTIEPGVRVLMEQTLAALKDAAADGHVVGALTGPHFIIEAALICQLFGFASSIWPSNTHALEHSFS